METRQNFNDTWRQVLDLQSTILNYDYTKEFLRENESMLEGSDISRSHARLSQSAKYTTSPSRGEMHSAAVTPIII